MTFTWKYFCALCIVIIIIIIIIVVVVIIQDEKKFESSENLNNVIREKWKLKILFWII